MISSFETKRLHLRGLKPQDSTSYQKNFNDYEVIRYLSHQVPWPYPEDGAEQFLKNVILPQQGINRWTWGIFLKECPNEVIGAVDLWREGIPEHRGFWLTRRMWGQGIMTEAIAPITDYAFKSLGFERLIFSNAVGNIRSRRLKEKVGARFLEVRKAQFVDPFFTKKEIWELKREDWIS